MSDPESEEAARKSLERKFGKTDDEKTSEGEGPPVDWSESASEFHRQHPEKYMKSMRDRKMKDELSTREYEEEMGLRPVNAMFEVKDERPTGTEEPSTEESKSSIATEDISTNEEPSFDARKNFKIIRK